MDAAMAALLGAGVGALGTSAAATIAGFFAYRNIRLQAQNQALQARSQLRHEYLRDRRETRRIAYSEYIEQAQKIHGTINAESIGPGTHIAELPDQLGVLNRLRARVAVEGPADIGNAGEALYSTVQAWFVARVTESPDRDRLTQLGVAIGPATERFTAAARDALDDDGSIGAITGG
ncbi:hypothetical protein [Streptomyces sp. NBC_01565]|uniref:hypothetical protein n=1 Tax=Streptomyces sp. NBC_01565 TaxID=2975881 RepID=UPI00225BF1AD|nr:hypothetical protein [Streptomyces sp. NBC_01565]MCX4542695.1 hypothetical protein [Streptomyces sp. NBC_01565]